MIWKRQLGVDAPSFAKRRGKTQMWTRRFFSIFLCAMLMGSCLACDAANAATRASEIVDSSSQSSNVLAGTIGLPRVEYEMKNGTARLTLAVNQAGEVSVAGKFVAAFKARAQSAESVVLAARPTKAGRKILKRTGHLITSVTITFRPSDGGASATFGKGLTLREQRPTKNVATGLLVPGVAAVLGGALTIWRV
jgi:hypothetical protein